ncbi:hypothetical protein ACVWZV_001856 [Bradyrhizobium sp. GM5.1]
MVVDMAAAFMAAAVSTVEAASTVAEDISVASAAVVSTLVASGPHPPFMAAAIVTAEFATMAEADSIATASIVPPITAIAIFHRRYYGGYYPYYSHPRRCRVIWTYYGPRRVCRWHRWHHPYRYW